MRGTLCHAKLLSIGNGIIPAYAGNTTVANIDVHMRWDHPRVCGEHQIGASVIIPLVGSSPRMRGTRVLSIFAVISTGIIPAYAGNTVWKRTVAR